MKKGIAIGLALLMALMMTACGRRGVTEPAPEEEAEGYVVSATPVEKSAGSAASGESRIAVSVPDGWEAAESDGMLYSYRKDSASFMIKTVPFTAGSLDMVVHQARDIFDGTFDDVEYIGETESVTVGGLDARKLIFTSDFSGFFMKFEYVYLLIDGDVYAIIFGDLGDAFDGKAADFQAILGGISIS